MIRASTVTLISTLPESNGVYESPALSEREVPCDVMSVSRTEMYEALNHMHRPEWTLLLGDYREYQDEATCRFEDKLYKIIRTYVRTDHRIELVIERMTHYDV